MESKITSLQHPFIKHLVKLREDRAYRLSSGSIVVCGLNLIRDLAPKFAFSSVLLEETFSLPFPIETQKIYRAPRPLLKKASGLVEPEPIVAEIPIPKEQDISTADFLLVLDGISDPGNLGTLLRSARGLGWDAVFLTPRSADPFNDKAIRSAKGATFTAAWKRGSYEELASLLETRPLYSADARGNPLSQFQFRPPLALALGNESQGLAPELKKNTHLIAIPMKEGMDSLNVAAAGAILMHALKQ